MKRVLFRIACAVALAALVSSAGFAQEKKKNMVHVGGSFLLPTAEQRFTIENNRAVFELDKAYGLSIGYQRMIGAKMGLDFDVHFFETRDTARRMRVPAQSDKYTLMPAVLGLTFHTGGEFDIYGGPAVAYVTGDRDATVAPAVTLGLDATLGRRGWILRVNFKYIHFAVTDDEIDPKIAERLDVDLSGFDLDVNANPIIATAGIAYRF